MPATVRSASWGGWCRQRQPVTGTASEERVAVPGFVRRALNGSRRHDTTKDMASGRVAEER